MEAAYFSEMLVDYQQTIWRYLQEIENFLTTITTSVLTSNTTVLCNSSLMSWSTLFCLYFLLFLYLMICTGFNWSFVCFVYLFKACYMPIILLLPLYDIKMADTVENWLLDENDRYVVSYLWTIKKCFWIKLHNTIGCIPSQEWLIYFIKILVQ